MVLRYMDNIKDDSYYVSKIIKDLDFMIKNTKGIEKKELASNEVLLDSMLFRLIQISENIKKLSLECRNNNKQIPWNEISGFRNRIVHDYGNVDVQIIYDVVKNDIYDLLDMFNNMK